MANQMKGNTFKSQWEPKWKQPNRLKRGKTRVTQSRLASFLDQSQSEVKQNQNTPGLLSILNLKML